MRSTARTTRTPAAALLGLGLLAVVGLVLAGAAYVRSRVVPLCVWPGPPPAGALGEGPRPGSRSLLPLGERCVWSTSDGDVTTLTYDVGTNLAYLGGCLLVVGAVVAAVVVLVRRRPL